MYYTHLYQEHKEQWIILKKRYIIIWLSINIILFILAILWIFFGIKYEEVSEKGRTWLDNIYSYFSSFIFFTLVMVLAWYGWKIAKLLKTKTEVILFSIFIINYLDNF